MAETRFTPGPWVAQSTGDASWNIIVGDGWMVGEVMGNDKPTDAANAALIAAAPTLHDALENIINKINEYGEASFYNTPVADANYFQQAQAALAKARGEHDA